MNNYLLESQEDILQGYHLDEVISIELSPNNKLFATGGYDGYLILWEISTPIKKIGQTDIHTSVLNIKFDPQSKFIACGSQDYLTIYLIDISKPNKLRVVLLDDCRLIFTNNYKYFINSRHIYTLEGRKILKNISIYSNRNDYLKELSISKNEKMILAHYSHSTIRIFTFPKLEIIFQQNVGQNINISFSKIEFSKNDDTIIALRDSTLTIWNISDFLKDNSKIPKFRNEILIFSYNLESTLCPYELRRLYYSSALCFTQDQNILIFADNWNGQIVILRNNKIDQRKMIKDF